MRSVIIMSPQTGMSIVAKVSLIIIDMDVLPPVTIIVEERLHSERTLASVKVTVAMSV